ncbi:hypothetical protein ACFXKF_26525 [Streptomyces scopuliridis]|uniref:hypothetical protein n=1 Tax=Streptomyces scopuliridis TaxID=452529 RepID=UPI0036A5B02B
MGHTPMPEPMRRAVNQLTSEAVECCREVLSYAGSDVARDWKRMTLYRATDAADTTDCVAMLIAAYCRHTGMAPETLQGYLQLGRQQSRAAGPQDEDRAHLAGLLGQAAPAGSDEPGALRMLYGRGQRRAQGAQRPEVDRQALFTTACLHGPRAELCDGLSSLGRLPSEPAAMARRSPTRSKCRSRPPCDVLVERRVPVAPHGTAAAASLSARHPVASGRSWADHRDGGVSGAGRQPVSSCEALCVCFPGCAGEGGVHPGDACGNGAGALPGEPHEQARTRPARTRGSSCFRPWPPRGLSRASR